MASSNVERDLIKCTLCGCLPVVVGISFPYVYSGHAGTGNSCNYKPIYKHTEAESIPCMFVCILCALTAMCLTIAVYVAK